MYDNEMDRLTVKSVLFQSESEIDRLCMCVHLLL